jgi:hypothetical protein
VPAAELLDRLLEVLIQIATQLRQVGAAAFENPLAVGVVRQREQEMLERQVGVPARHGFTKRDRQNDFKSL